MGATPFMDYVRGVTDVQTAYLSAVQQAQWDHGHSGYTGTIAEKSGFIEFKIPESFTAQQVIDAIENPKIIKSPNGYEHYEPSDELVEIFGSDAINVYRTYDDKWGPAVALKWKEGNGWLFMGWASC
jgi:hypothetical protein